MKYLIVCLSFVSFVYCQENVIKHKFDNDFSPILIHDKVQQEDLKMQNFLYYKQFDLKLKELNQLLGLLKRQSQSK